MTGNIKSHHLLEELFGDRVERKEGVTVNLKQFTLRRVRAPLGVDLGLRQRRIETEHLVQPFLDGVARCISNWFGQGDFPQGPSTKTLVCALGSFTRGSISNIDILLAVCLQASS